MNYDGLEDKVLNLKETEIEGKALTDNLLWERTATKTTSNLKSSNDV